jgi:WD40 repeat protein
MSVLALKWLNDDRLASAGSDLNIRFWSIYNQSLVKTRTGAHTGPIQALALLTNGYLVSASDSPDYAIKFWNSSSYTFVFNITKAHGANLIYCLESLPNGYLASGGADSNVKIWNSTFSLVYTLSGHAKEVRALEYLSTIGLLVSGSEDSTIRFWNATNGTFLKSNNPLGNYVLALKELPNNQVAIGGTSYLKIYNMVSLNLAYSLSIGANIVNSLVLYSNQLLLAGLNNGTILLVNISSNYKVKASLNSSSCASNVFSLEVPGGKN